MRQTGPRSEEIKYGQGFFLRGLLWPWPLNKKLGLKSIYSHVLLKGSLLGEVWVRTNQGDRKYGPDFNEICFAFHICFSFDRGNWKVSVCTIKYPFNGTLCSKNTHILRNFESFTGKFGHIYFSKVIWATWNTVIWQLQRGLVDDHD